jgi:SET domain
MTVSELLPMSAVILKLVLVILFNRKLIYSHKVNFELAGLAGIEIGEALYLASSLINHACDPNMYLVSYGSHAVYRARRPIEQGEQLTDCYGVSVAMANYEERQAMTNNMYKFLCRYYFHCWVN